MSRRLERARGVSPLRTAAGLLLLSLASVALAGAELDRAKEAYAAGEFEAALAALRPLAESGDAEAQFMLGFLLAEGRGTAEDPPQAVTWYERAAERGHAQAQFNLGLAYAKGRGVAEDPARAFELYRAAAEQGLARAQYLVAELYEQGRGVERDLVRAHFWFSIARSQRFADAKKRKRRVARQMDDRQIAHAELLARQWRQSRKESGSR